MLKVALVIFISVLVASHLGATAVKRIGLPLVNNFPQSEYGASTQNWALTQNSKGFIYAANNDGLLEFDGQHWMLYPVPNKSIIRSLLAVGDTIYVGAFEEFGYFAPDHNGKLTYHSLVELVPDTARLFDEIWKIHKVYDELIFQSFSYLFVYNNGEISIIEPGEKGFGHSFFALNSVFVVDYSKGLLRLKKGRVELVSNHPLFFYNEVRCILPFDNNSLLIGLVNHGLFLLSGGQLIPWQTDVNKQLIEHIVFCGEKLKGGHFVFGSIFNGIYITNQQGKILQHINRYKGLQNNTVLSLFEDRQGSLWLGLDNGIDYIEINSPLSVFDHNHNLGSVYTSLVHNETLYVGTNQGLFYVNVRLIDETASANTDFNLVPGTEGQVWHLEEVDGQLLCGHNFGLFQITGNKAVKISGERGYWTFIRHRGKSDTLIAGTYNGLKVLVKHENTWKVSGTIEGFTESSRKIVQHHANTLWISHGYRGIYKVTVSNNLQVATSFKLYNQKQGLPAELPYNVHMINGNLVFSTKEGFFSYDEPTGRFFPAIQFNEIFKNQLAIDNIFPDKNGNLWYSAFGRMGLIRLLEDGTYTNIFAPFNRISSLLIQSYEHVYVFDSRNVFIGSQKGLFHYDPYFKKDYRNQEPVFFREVVFSGKDTLFTLFDPIALGLQASNNKASAFTVPYRLNSVSFRFACPSFEDSGSTQFSFRLVGFNATWTPWESKNFKEYTNLREGSYAFEVRAHTINAGGGPPFMFAFEVLPPFYRSGKAYMFYVMVIVLIVGGNLVYVRRRITRARIKEKALHEKRMLEQEIEFKEKEFRSEMEIFHLRNESLQNQVNFKNRELANTTLHLINKNRILNSIKQQLNTLTDSTPATAKRSEIEALVNKINKELRNDRTQNLFDQYFDDVHQDFLTRLKEKHPDLAPKELRLCAYLKMNLTTKEIAPLMNISVRGVEIGRYRLRKKLNLCREANLLNYLINF